MEDNQNITDNIENNENIPDNIENTSNASSDNGEELESSSLSHFRTNGRGMLNSGARGLDNFTRRANNFNRRLGNFSNKVGNKANETGKNKELADKIKNGSDNLNKKVGGLNSFNNKVQSANNVKNLLQDPGQATNIAKNMALDAAGDALKNGAKKVVSNVILKNPYVLAIIGIFLFFIIIVVAIAGVDEDDFFKSDSFAGYTSGNTQMWWPIGSKEKSVMNGADFATSSPSCTNVTSPFGPRNGKDHKGIDIACGIEGENIIAVLDGKVTDVVTGCPSWDGKGEESTGVVASCGGGYGNRVYIDHGNGIITIYAHLQSVIVKSGTSVKQGQIIGTMGRTGHVSGATGIHLHFEIKKNGSSVNPTNYISSSDSRPVSSNVIVMSGVNIQVGTDAQQTVCLTLKKANLSDAAVAGIMGNIQRESGFNSGSVNKLGCVGLVQWCYGRKDAIKNTYGSGWSNINNQLNYILYEITQTSEKQVMKYLQGNYSSSEMAYQFCNVYERPEAGECDNGKRQNFANTFYPYVVNGCK